MLIKLVDELVPEIPRDRKPSIDHRKIVLSADAPRTVVFITYARYEFGPKEAESAVQLQVLELEHIGFQFIGKFCCPGEYLDNPIPKTVHEDICGRPNEKDLLKAYYFIEDKDSTRTIVPAIERVFEISSNGLFSNITGSAGLPSSIIPELKNPALKRTYKARDSLKKGRTSWSYLKNRYYRLLILSI